MDTNKDVQITMMKRRRRRRVRVGDPDFVPPDGGWGWLIIFASGFTNFSTFPMFQQYGFVFQKKFEQLNITEVQTTTIVNIGGALYFAVGLLNGPIFRKFTYRQVSMVGSSIVFLSLILCSFCSSFWSYILCYSILYGASFGMVQSSAAIALNTYFKEKRRMATGFSWTITALGPTIYPYIIVGLIEYYGVQGTVLLFAGMAMHSFPCALLLQPVEWHTKFREEENDASTALLQTEKVEESANLKRVNSKTLQNQAELASSFCGSYDIIGPEEAMLNSAMNGYLNRPRRGSKFSVTSTKSLKHLPEVESCVPSKRSSYVDKPDESHDDLLAKTLDKHQLIGSNIDSNEDSIIKSEDMVYNNQIDEDNNDVESNNESSTKKKTIWEKISGFFDFELLKDLVYVNILIGMTTATFVEMNFSILTPIILKEFNFPEMQIATFMSLLGTTDIVCRFTMPFVADKIGFSNRTFFLIGVLSMALARLFLIHIPTYSVALMVALVMGAGKALRTIFMALVIPSHVPLDRLPAALGLQLAFGGFVFITFGPLIGWTRRVVGNYIITLHILNLFTYGMAISWIVEFIIHNRKRHRSCET